MLKLICEKALTSIAKIRTHSHRKQAHTTLVIFLPFLCRTMSPSLRPLLIQNVRKGAKASVTLTNAPKGIKKLVTSA